MKTPTLMELAGFTPPHPVINQRFVSPLDNRIPPAVMHEMRGITLDQRGKWFVRTIHQGKEHSAGRFVDINDAKVARDKLEQELGKTIAIQSRLRGVKKGSA